MSLFSLRNIIDVSAADSVVMEQHEYMDKARQYRYVDKKAFDMDDLDVKSYTISLSLS